MEDETAAGPPATVPPSLDCRGVLRGNCNACSCPSFKRDQDSISCAECGHSPVKHTNLSNSLPLQEESLLVSPSFTDSLIEEEDSDIIMSDHSEDEEVPICAMSGCTREAMFDINTGDSSRYCERHHRIRSQRPSTSIPTSTRGAIPLATPLVPPSFRASTCKVPGCGRPAYVDPDTLVEYPGCGRTHSLEYQRMMAARTIIDPAMKCSNPDCTRPKYQEEDGTVYDYCGRSCRDSLSKSKRQEMFPIAASPETKCMLPGCNRQCYTDPKTGTMESFCGQSHARQAIKQILLELPQSSGEYDKVLKHFIKEWVKNPPAPPVHCIMKISNEKVKSTFTTYKDRIASGREWHFHGTSLSCDLKNNKTPCSNTKCGVCGIVKRGFDISLIGTNIARYKRFGHGFYLAPNSSKCHDYTQGYGTFRVMILCDVAPGKKHTVKDDQTHLTSPPAGYHSVYGAHGRALNYDEIVLYCSEAICPLYVIIYTKDGIAQIAK